jgi:methylthioribulose-1-phosphate dehydratase
MNTKPLTELLSEPRYELINSARYFYQQGWMLGTAGNLSARLTDGSFWITASGMLKGELVSNDFIRMYVDGKIVDCPEGRKPSAETTIHQAIYEMYPDSQACFHVHSVEANLVSNFVQGDELPLPPLEMLKGLGLWEENPQCMLPLFENHFEVPKIATEIKERFRDHKPQIPALLIRNHGVTVWAPSPTIARNYIEVIEYIFRYMVSACQISKSPNE